ncbi:MAG: S1 RNA-binding domain-containing protein, partial [Microcoleus sp.]
MVSTKTITMDELLEQAEIQQITPGEVVEGKVLSVRKHEVWIDLGGRGVGMVPRREIGFSR